MIRVVSFFVYRLTSSACQRSNIDPYRCLKDDQMANNSKNKGYLSLLTPLLLTEIQTTPINTKRYVQYH
ncbi:protein of unknown function [Pseudomonas sp. JV551A1]|uniref:Uncharacterized protein n=1 Tax=Pseudomonas inefficax TaxID=2078786 RepID=A0AAQ1PBL6_9PSED|nr:protein of unknown function [Pseudomonas sp. JV551A1]SPO62103.1 protein of unknown function [Pseudomonas inefficax]